MSPNASRVGGTAVRGRTKVRAAGPMRDRLGFAGSLVADPHTENDLTEETLQNWLQAILRGEMPVWTLAEDAATVEGVYAFAVAQGVAELLGQRLDEAAANVSPAPLRARLRQRAKAATALELSREIELERALERLAAAESTPLILKGTALAYGLYPAPQLRPRCDTDFLLPDRQAAERVWLELEALGYRRQNAVSGEFVSYQFSCHRDDVFGVTHALDIHWRINNNQVFAQRFGFAELAAAARPIPALGPHARGLAPVHALLLACMHRAGHLSAGEPERLVWLYDLHLLACGLSPDEWTWFRELAVARGIGGICQEALAQAHDRFGSPIPQGVASALADAAAGEWLKPARSAGPWRNYWNGLRALPDVRSRCLWVLETLFPSPDYLLAKYQTEQRWRLPLLYLHRILVGLHKRSRS